MSLLIFRIVGAACTGYLIWTGMARERWTRRPRTWFFDRFPPDGYRYEDRASAIPKRFVRVEQFHETTDIRKGPHNVPAFIIIAGQMHSMATGVPVRYEGQLPAPCLMNMGEGGPYKLMSGDAYVSGWVEHSASGLYLIPEADPLPTRRAVLTTEGWRVHDGTWPGNWLDCYRCAGFWITAISVLVVLNYHPEWVTQGLAVAIGACLVRWFGNRNL